MKIRAKVIALLSAVFLILTIAEWAVSQRLLLPRFEQIERDDARTAMTRIDHGVRQSLAGLQVSASDWGNWADTYRFVQDRNAAYAGENLTTQAMKQLHITALAFVDINGEYIWTGALDPASGGPQDLDLFAGHSLPVALPWRDSLLTAAPRQGLVATNRGVLLAAISPILDGFGHGPSLGLVLMGRLLTKSELSDIGDRAQTSVTSVPLRGPAASAPSASLADPASGLAADVVVTDGTTMVYRTFDDVYGRPLMTLRVDVPRKITAHARSTVASAMLFTAGTAVAVLLFMLVVLDRMVLAPLARVTRHAVAIGKGDDLTTRLNLVRADEIGALASEFDRMVAKVADSRRQMIDHSFHAGMAELSRGVLHNLGNAMTPLSVRVAKLEERLRGAPTADAKRALEERDRQPTDSGRQADLDEFVRLACSELADVVIASQSDADVIGRQTAIVQNALAEQLRSSRGASVIESLELPVVINQTLEIVPDACRERISVELDRSVAAVGAVRMARTVLRLVLQNLIINASEAIRAAGRSKGTVRFCADIVRAAGQDALALTCADTGVGIATENLDRVFERGYSTKHGSGNLGIGLHWCATAVNALGGRIWATSAGPDQGAMFHLVIPLPELAASAATEAA